MQHAISIIINVVLSTAVFSYYYCSLLTPKRDPRFTAAMLFCGLSVLYSSFVPIQDKLVFKLILAFIIEYILCRLLFLEKGKRLIFYVLFNNFAPTLSEMITLAYIMGLADSSIPDYLNAPFVSMSLFFAFLIDVVLVKAIKTVRNRLSIWQILSLLPFPVSQMLLMLLFTMISAKIRDNLPLIYYISMILITAFAIISDIFLLNAIQDLANKNELAHQNELLDTQYKLQLEHYSAMAQQQNQIRAMRHDISNHIQTMGALIASGSREQAEDYFENLRKQYQSSVTTDYCSDRLVDAVLHNKITFAHSCGIKTSVAVRIPESCGIDRLDFMSVFSNLLDNAIEACQQLPEKDRFLNISAGESKGFLTIQVENSALPAEKDFSTTKEDKQNHGLGLKIVSRISKKYDGALSCRSESGCFYASVILRLQNC